MPKTRESYTEHPSIVVINGKPKLRVMEDFFVEEKLPKWRKIQIDIDNEDNGMSPGQKMMELEARSILATDSGHINDHRAERDLVKSAKYDRQSYLRRMASAGDTKTAKRKVSWWRRLFVRNEEPEKEIGEDAEKVFDEAKTALISPTTEELIRAKKVVDDIEQRLNMSGQYEIADRIVSTRGVLDAEMAIVSKGDLKYLTEDQVVRFMLKSERGVRIDFLRYWSDILPPDIAQKKINADGMLVFDNYCVMYYDPNAPKFSIIETVIDDEARRKRRDPILFGMIHGSRRLYYVADWTTKDDDLTMEKLEEILGEKTKDLGEYEPDDLGDSIRRMLDRIVVNVEDEAEDLRRKGALITDDNFVEFYKTGVVPALEDKSVSVKDAPDPETKEGE